MTCPHCPDGHTPPTGGSQPWSAWVDSSRDGDGQPMQITVARSAGAHVAESDAQWVRERLNGRESAGLPEQHSIALDYLESLAGRAITETDRLRLLLILDDSRIDGPLCGNTQTHDGHTYPPCARPSGHIEAYCRDAKRTSYFIAAESAGSQP